MTAPGASPQQSEPPPDAASATEARNTTEPVPDEIAAPWIPAAGDGPATPSDAVQPAPVMTPPDTTPVAASPVAASPVAASPDASPVAASPVAVSPDVTPVVASAGGTPFAPLSGPASYVSPLGVGPYAPPPNAPAFGAPQGPVVPQPPPPGFFVPTNPGQPRKSPWRNPWLVAVVVVGVLLNVAAGVFVFFADEDASEGCAAIKQIAESGRPTLRPMQTKMIAEDLAVAYNDTLATVGRDYLLALEAAYGGTDPRSLIMEPVDPDAAAQVQGPAAARALIDATYQACGDTWVWTPFDPPQ
ncbi:hypothetical protein J2S43_002111 [Catenuloplanes nepalensis]|uniref:Uncharacterized protein n=1 Tax=Catenuloplanes nepalensis TaxID=587533 RepID=A0ABT9MQ92_9ACTN|nr:hypothetical protein [Catenuloplanes nepalensis]MDP9793599.1 hypothetical protein [Catenuloplanes nepalensis]